MTKHRAPLSVEQALQRMAGLLTAEAMAGLTDRQPRTVRNWMDPDTPEDVPVGCAIRLDLAYQEAGGGGAPLFEAYAHALEQAALTRYASRHSLARLTAEAIREGGEAHAALVEAAQPGSGPNELRRAEKEAGEALEKLTLCIASLAAERERAPP